MPVSFFHPLQLLCAVKRIPYHDVWGRHISKCKGSHTFVLSSSLTFTTPRAAHQWRNHSHVSAHMYLLCCRPGWSHAATASSPEEYGSVRCSYTSEVFGAYWEAKVSGCNVAVASVLVRVFRLKLVSEWCWTWDIWPATTGCHHIGGVWYVISEFELKFKYRLSRIEY